MSHDDQLQSNLLQNNDHRQRDRQYNINELHLQQMNPLALKLFQAYCQVSGNDIEFYSNEEMVSVLLEIKTVSTSPRSTTSQASTFVKSVIEVFMELRSQSIGNIGNIEIANNNDMNTNRFSTNDIVVFNYDLFHAALSTNSPMIIDAVIPYINYDFTTLDIQHDQIEQIKQMNVIYNLNNEIYPTNYILQAIVDATENGHFESIQHLINNHQLSPTISICHHMFYIDDGCTNLLYHAAYGQHPLLLSRGQNGYNPQLVEYLFPLCFQSTNEKNVHSIVFMIASQGLLHLIKKIHIEYGINLSQLPDEYDKNLLHYAAQSNNIELIDYLVDVIGLSINQPGILESAIHSYQWDTVKHLITKYNITVPLTNNVLDAIHQDIDITPDTINYIIKTFSISPQLLLKPLATNCNITSLRYVIENYNVNPHYLYREINPKGVSLLHAALLFNPLIKSPQLLETVAYLCQLGLDVNRVGGGSVYYTFENKTPIEWIGGQDGLMETRFQTFKLLLQYKATIPDVIKYIKSAVEHHNFLIVQYLIELVREKFNFDQLEIRGEPFLHHVLRKHSSIEFITYLLSINTFDVNKPDRKGETPILHAIQNVNFDINVIKLLIEHGARVPKLIWFELLDKLLFCNKNLSKIIQCLDYFKTVFGFDIHTLSPDHYRACTTQLLQFSLKKLNFRYSTIKYDKYNFHMVLSYRALIHHYNTNVNCQDYKINTGSTVFHHLATNHHYELIQFTLSHSYHKPNIYLVNAQGQTFLHILVSNCNEWFISQDDCEHRCCYQEDIIEMFDIDGVEDGTDSDLIITDDEINDRCDNFEKVLDCIIDLNLL